MTNNAKEMLKQFVYLVLDDENGINSDAYKMLTEMMIHDREMASILHDTVDMATESTEGRFAINP
jgi:hypothetical protein